MQYLKHNPNKMWIRKPLASSRGRGIRVLSKPGKISPTCNKCILQEYIQRPLCVHGFKFDMRIYVAITSFHPMRAYVFQNGVLLPRYTPTLALSFADGNMKYILLQDWLGLHPSSMKRGR